MAVLLVLQDVSYAHARAHARQRPGTAGFRLENINLQIEAGGFYGILGGNGSGKSTLARLCCGLILPDTGTVLVEGCSTREEVNRQKIRQTVGLVFQNPENQLVAETVATETAFALENLGVPSAEIRRRVREVLDRFDLGHLAGAPPHRLSGGEKRRLALAAVWILRPKVLLLDEPLGMLDPGNKKKVCGLLQELRREGTALLWFTTAFTEVAGADQLLVLEAGRVAWQGRPNEFLGEAARVRRWGIELPPVYEVAAGLSPSPPPVAGEEEFLSWLWQ